MTIDILEEKESVVCRLEKERDEYRCKRDLDFGVGWKLVIFYFFVFAFLGVGIGLYLEDNFALAPDSSLPDGIGAAIMFGGCIVSCGITGGVRDRTTKRGLADYDKRIEDARIDFARIKRRIEI